MQINISKCIFQFLKSYGSVNLSGLGIIALQRIPAIINNSGKAICPPQTYFDFFQAKENDNTFISWLAQSTSTSEIICANILQKYIDRIYSLLDKEEIFYIPLVGTFSSEDGSIGFQGDSWSPYYKYPDLAISQIPVQKKSLPKPKAARGWMWVIPIFLFILAASFIGWKSYQSYHTKIAFSESTLDPEKQGRTNQTPLFDSMLTKDSIIGSQVESNKNEETKKEVIQIDSFDHNMIGSRKEDVVVNEVDDMPIENELPDEKVKHNTQDDCIVIVGAFRNSSNVDRMMKRLSEDGLSPWKSSYRGLVRVGAKTSCDPTDLNTLLSNCKSKYDQSAWVLE